MNRYLSLAGLGIVVALSSGCATLTKGTQQTVTVNTDPTGATCTLTRDGLPLAVINPTPGSIPIDKGAKTVAILCKRGGHLDATGSMSSEFQAMTFGNILFGGLIGVAVDAASGAMHEYPAMVTITLIPESFPTTPERDAFFARMKATLEKEAAEVKERIAVRCGVSDCTQNLEAADVATRTKLREIEQQRLAARVVAP